MKGYFSRIVSRSVGIPAKSGLKPLKPTVWPGARTAVEGEATSSDLLPITEWPSAFDGNPVVLPQQPIAQQGSVNIQPNTPAAPSSFPISSEVIHTPGQLTPQVNEIPYVPPTPLTPQNVQVDTGISSPIPPKTTYLNQDELVEKTQTPPTVLTPNPLAEMDKLFQDMSGRKEPVKTPFPQTMKEVNMTEGVMEMQPRTEPPKSQPLSPNTETKAKAEVQMPITEKQNLVPPPPATQERRSVEPNFGQTQREYPTLQPEKKTIALLPSAPQPSAILPNPSKQHVPANNLVIGKITIEVVDAPKPSVAVQPPVAPQAKPSTQRKTHSRRDSILKYGLGQL